MGTNIIDTNVIAVANGKYLEEAEQCKFSCITFLGNIVLKRLKVFIDDKQEIFKEYFRYANRSGQPGVGDTFAKWLFDNQANEVICECVVITPIDENRKFEEIPNTGAFDDFDNSDKKFLAVAFASQFNPTIHNATDSDWESIGGILPSYQIYLNQLC